MSTHAQTAPTEDLLAASLARNRRFAALAAKQRRVLAKAHRTHPALAAALYAQVDALQGEMDAVRVGS